VTDATSQARVVHDSDRVRIFDTTLRDGEQAPGCTMSISDKLSVARQLARLGVDVIEAGFPAASPGDREAVHAIATEVGTPDGPIVCGLARAVIADISQCDAAIRPAALRRIHTFIATSDIHLAHKLRMSREQVIARVREAVSCARSLCDDVEFSAEDATRSDTNFLCDVLATAIAAGATTINVPDTVGYTTPFEYEHLMRRICELASGAPEVVISTHCHDDLGLATANSLAGVRAGARQVECTINGIGERAGNAALEEIVMAIGTRPECFGVSTSIDTRELALTSRIVARCTGVDVPPNKAVVGANAFAHEAGIHQDGMIKNPATYEIMTPEAVGAGGTQLVFGKHSGRHALMHRLTKLGIALDDSHFQEVFTRLKSLADNKMAVDDKDIVATVSESGQRLPQETA